MNVTSIFPVFLEWRCLMLLQGGGACAMNDSCRATGGDQVQLEVTDGWYGVRATIDGPLCHYVASGVLRTGVPMLTTVCTPARPSYVS